ncbi:MAG TPA: Rieske (2Fe-2S) protein [Streptosporangiaceae bacterium]|nr:Rieske (2Fe-2S) protein [Streptosporangiaceae bacterium]
MSDQSSRRALLAGAVCIAGLAGCARYDTSNGGLAGGAPLAQGGGAPAAQGNGAPSPAAGPVPPAGSARPEVLASTADIPVGGGKILTDKKVVITQPRAGSFDAFSAVCTHQGCIVGTVSGGTINCPCHGSKFSITDGSVVNGPATTGLAPVNIQLRGTSIVPA